MHLSILEVGIRILCPHHLLVKDRLTVFDPSYCEFALVEFCKQLLVSGPSSVNSNLSLENGLAYLDSLCNFGVIAESGFYEWFWQLRFFIFKAILVYVYLPPCM